MYVKADSTKSGNLKSKIALGAFLANNILFEREAMIGRVLFDETLCCKLQTSISSLSEVWDWAPNPRLQMIRKWSLKLVWVGDYFSKPDLFMRGLWIFFPICTWIQFLSVQKTPEMAVHFMEREPRRSKIPFQHVIEWLWSQFSGISDFKLRILWNRPNGDRSKH